MKRQKEKKVFFTIQKKMKWKPTSPMLAFHSLLVERIGKWSSLTRLPPTLTPLPPLLALSSPHLLLVFPRLHNFSTGTILLDMEESDFPHIINAIVEEMIDVGQIKKTNRQDVLKALLLKRR